MYEQGSRRMPYTQKKMKKASVKIIDLFHFPQILVKCLNELCTHAYIISLVRQRFSINFNLDFVNTIRQIMHYLVLLNKSEAPLIKICLHAESSSTSKRLLTPSIMTFCYIN